MRNKTLWIVRTAVLLALLIVLQAATKAGGQFITGSCVNAVLAVAVMISGLWSGITVALLSPFFAYLLGIGPQLIHIVPAIALGNLTYVVLLHFLCKGKVVQQCLGWVISAAAKCSVLYLLVAVLLCNVLPLKPPQIAMFQAMFSWPQLVTALSGGGIAILLVPTVKKPIK